MTQRRFEERIGGPIEWMIATGKSNLLMLVLLRGGLLYRDTVKQEAFLNSSWILSRSGSLSGFPARQEVEQGIILVVEEAIRGLKALRRLQRTN